MKNMHSKVAYLDPPSSAYYGNLLFDSSNPVLNRDNSLAPFLRLHSALNQQGISLYTADNLLKRNDFDQKCDYYSLGILDNYEVLSTNDDIRLRAFVILEPPVVDPSIYHALPKLTSVFDYVFIHNVDGDGYSLKGVDKSKLRKLYWPQPHNDVLVNFWENTDRLRRIVMINGNHKPASYNGELYSKRIEALSELSRFSSVDLYGRGWEKWWSRSSMWLPYWQNRKTLMSIFKGACQSKSEVMSQYMFSLCFENMEMKGYITEKIFDCFYSGTIPIYFGAKDIIDLVPKDAYIDFREFNSWEELHKKVMGLSDAKILTMRNAGRAFIKSPEGLRFYDSLVEIFS